MGATYALGRFIIAPLGRLLYRPQVEGSETSQDRPGHLREQPPVVRRLDRDPVASPRPVHFLAKASYFDGNGLKGWLSREFFTAIGAVPVNRGAGQAALDALDQQAQMLDDGQRGRPLSRGHPLTRRPPVQGPHRRGVPRPPTGAPVVPVGLIGTDKVMPVGAKMPVDQAARHRPVRRAARPRATTVPPTPAAPGAGHGRHHGRDPRPLRPGARERVQRGPAHDPIERIKQVLPHERR